METPTVKEIITGYIENDMFGCHYLFKALTCFKRAIANYNNPINGVIELSFTDFHKAINGLWMAEIKSRKNNKGNLINPQDPGKVHSIESYYSVAGNLYNFDSSKFSDNFKIIAQQDTPMSANYFLVYKLRNIDQHDFTETLPGLYGEITSKLNPYILANQVNFISTYRQVYKFIDKDCKSHRGQKASHKCMFPSIEDPDKIEEYITIPITYNHIKNNLEALSGVELKIFSEYNSKHKNTRNVHFQKMISTKIVEIEKIFQERNGAKLSKCKKEYTVNSPEYLQAQEEIRIESLQWKYTAGDQESILATIQKNSNIATRYFENYTFPTPKSIAREIFRKNEILFNPQIYEKISKEKIINNIYNKVLNIRDELVKSKSNVNNKYWIVGWNKKVHYNRAFLSLAEGSDSIQKLLEKYKV